MSETMTLSPADALRRIKRLARGKYIYLRQRKDVWPFVQMVELTRKAAAELIEVQSDPVEITIAGDQLIIGAPAVIDVDLGGHK